MSTKRSDKTRPNELSGSRKLDEHFWLHFEETNMAFVNECIPKEDKKKYNITSRNLFYRACSSDWVVDRERDVFLVLRASHGGAEGISPMQNWAFHWRGHLLDVLLLNVSTGGDERTGHAWSHKRVLRIDPLTAELEAQRTQIMSDLRDALTVHRVSGLHSEFKSYEVIFDAE
jgi:hypothetical protein